MIQQITLECKTGQGFWSETQDNIYLGVYGKHGGREFALQVNGTSPFDKEQASFSLTLGEGITNIKGLLVDKSINKEVNDPTLNPLHLNNIEYVYLRKSGGISNKTDDWATFSEIIVHLFHSTGKVRTFAKKGAINFSKESGLKHWLSEADNPIPSLEIVDGRAYFQSQKEFDIYVQQLNDVDLEKVEQYHEQLGFISFYDLMHQTRKIDHDALQLNNDIQIDLEDPFITHILNYNLEVQIGDRIHRVEQNYSFSYEKGHYQEVVHFNQRPLGNISNAQLTEINQHLSVAAHTNTAARNVWAIGFGWKTNPKWESFGHKKVMKATQWITNLYFYKGMGINVRYQEYKGWWIFKHWQDVKAEYLELNCEVTVKISRRIAGHPTTSFTQFNRSKKRSNKKFIGITIDESVMFNINPNSNIPVSPGSADLIYEIESLNSTHKCMKFGTLKSINLNWIW